MRSFLSPLARLRDGIRCPNRTGRSPGLRYGSALAGVALATLVRFLLTPWLGHHSVFLLLLPAILFSSWYGGFGPGLMAIVVGALLSGWLFLPSLDGARLADPGEPLALLLFVFAGFLVMFLSMAQQEAQYRAESSARVANEQRAQIEALNQRLGQAMVESNHRIKNNLQVVTALLGLYAMGENEAVPVDALQRIQHHVQTLAALHDLLTLEAKKSPQAAMLPLRAMLDKIVPMLQATAGGRNIVYQSDDVCLPSNKGAAICLLLNELVGNALKHGAQEVSLAITQTGAAARLEVSDDGPGFPPEFDPREAANTGLELVENIGRHDLRGTIAYENRDEGGARVAVTFPIGAPA